MPQANIFTWKLNICQDKAKGIFRHEFDGNLKNRINHIVLIVQDKSLKKWAETLIKLAAKSLSQTGYSWEDNTTHLTFFMDLNISTNFFKE